MKSETEPCPQVSVNAEEQTRVQLRHRVGFNDSSCRQGKKLTELGGPALREEQGPRGKGVGEGRCGVSRCKLLYTACRNNKVLLYSTENYIQSPAINHNRKEYVEEYLYMYV